MITYKNTLNVNHIKKKERKQIMVTVLQPATNKDQIKILCI